jgi:hypothetical protein
MQRDLEIFWQQILPYIPPKNSIAYLLLLIYTVISLMGSFFGMTVFKPTQTSFLVWLAYPFFLTPVSILSLLLFFGISLYLHNPNRFKADTQLVLKLTVLPILFFGLILFIFSTILPINTLIAILMEMLILGFFYQELRGISSASMLRFSVLSILIPQVILIFSLLLKSQSAIPFVGLVSLHKALLLAFVLKYRNHRLPVLQVPAKHLPWFLVAFCFFELLFEPYPTAFLSFLGLATGWCLLTNAWQPAILKVQLQSLKYEILAHRQKR